MPNIDSKPTVALFAGYVIIVILLLALILTSCSSRITDANQGVLISYEKIPRSTYFKVTVRVDSCEEYVTRWNSQCWQCKESQHIPLKWSIVRMRNGRYYSEPVK